MSEFRNGLRGTLACACYTLRLYVYVYVEGLSVCINILCQLTYLCIFLRGEFVLIENLDLIILS